MAYNATPAFIKILYIILEDESNHYCISWSKGNDSIVITQPTAFALNVLPLHFKHNKFSSFVRQLNKHNFCRVKRQHAETQKDGEQACEYRHPMFQKGRKDLLERIARQPSASSAARKEKEAITVSNNNQSSIEDIDGKSSIFSPLPPAPIANQLTSLEQGQRRSFYQIKDLERRVDFIEKELGSCRYIVESQSRLIKRLLLTLPIESKTKNAAELNHLVTELNQNWHEPSFDPYPYHPANYGQSYQNSGVGTKSSSTPSVNSHASLSNSHNNNVTGNIPQSSNGSAGNRSDSNSNGMGVRSLTNTSAASKSESTGLASGFGSNVSANPTLVNNSSSMIQRNLNYHPFNNQASSSRWNGVESSSMPPVVNPDSFLTLNILILVSQQSEQRFLSDLLIELQCLSHKFAFDISHVIHCLEERKDFHILFLDGIYESESLLSRLRQLNPKLMIIFISDDHNPLSSSSSNMIRFVLRPPTLESVQICFQDYINPTFYTMH